MEPPPGKIPSRPPKRNDSVPKAANGSPVRPGTGSEEVTAQDFRDAEDNVTMGNLFQNLSAHPFAKLHHSLLVAGGTEVSALAGEGQKIFMAALCTSDPGKAVAQNATVQIAVDHGAQIGTVKPIGPLKALLIDLFKVLEVILHTLIIARILGSARTVGTVFRIPLTPLLGPMLYRDRDRLGLVVHRLFEIFDPM